MSFISLERVFEGINIDFFAYFKAIVLHGRDNFVYVDPRSPEQQILRGSSITNVKLSQVKIDIANGERCTTFET